MAPSLLLNTQKWLKNTKKELFATFFESECYIFRIVFVILRCEQAMYDTNLSRSHGAVVIVGPP